MTTTPPREITAFLSAHFSDSDPDHDRSTVDRFLSQASVAQCQALVEQIDGLLKLESLSLEWLGSEANRWFGEQSEARDWLSLVAARLRTKSGGGALAPKDSNGTPLAEGDAVMVIKDLKVKGGSSDLKRGTLIKKIHLTGDPEAVECRVDGSTLVLKTCFLKKS